MYRLFYISSANPNLAESDIHQLIATASLKNVLLNITGALGYDGDRFAQILEGEKATVLSLMETIKTDPRHSGIVIMGEKEVAGRVYDGWGMKNIEGLIFDDFECAMAEA